MSLSTPRGFNGIGSNAARAVIGLYWSAGLRSVLITPHTEDTAR